MVKLYLLPLILLLGCTVNSISPSGGGLDIDVDISKESFRHGWAYFSKPFTTKVESRDQDSIQRGRQLYLHHCQKCHGEKGRGDGSLAKALKIAPADLTKLPSGLSDTYILVQIKQGKGNMPMWRDFLTEKQSRDLTHFIIDLHEK